MKKSNNNGNGWNDDTLSSKLEESSWHKWTISDYSFNNVIVEYAKQTTCIL